MQRKYVFQDGLVLIRIVQRIVCLKKTNMVITTALKQVRSSAWKIGMEQIVQFTAKNTTGRSSVAIGRLEKKSVNEIGTEITVQLSAKTKIIQMGIFIVIKNQV